MPLLELAGVYCGFRGFLRKASDDITRVYVWSERVVSVLTEIIVGILKQWYHRGEMIFALAGETEG